MTPYSQDLRQRVLDTIQRGEGSVRQIARRFLVSVSFVTRLLHLHRTHRLGRAQTRTAAATPPCLGRRIWSGSGS